MSMRIERTLAVFGAAALLVLGFDTITLAATGQSLLLGRINTAGATTTVSNTGASPVLNLLSGSTSAAPFTTNARGRVFNLNADKIDGLDSTQVIDRARIPLVTFNRTNVTQTPINVSLGTIPMVRSNAGAVGTFALSSTATFVCGIHAPGALGYSVTLYKVFATGIGFDSATQLAAKSVPLTGCGKAVAFAATVAMQSFDRLAISVRSTGCASTCVDNVPLRFSAIAVKGLPVTKAL